MASGRFSCLVLFFYGGFGNDTIFKAITLGGGGFAGHGRGILGWVRHGG